ncbi:DUF4123 domain-containing protein [Oceanicola sp. D3]|uniref:DUF4123 domain-containing protein n=1 Tax=Oceanicola sp. D3 TaxID=2587163 RepID=UPI00111EAE09|nr:DUF4123 domain-containing protein [Oceanicola sp. D3]QDC10126.1 DUF4123 domain-containing protein [Oceanicola sp. D3]
MTSEQAQTPSLPQDTGTAAFLGETQIEGVQPLDAQIGVDAPKTVPDALQELLFGQPAATPDETAAAGGDASALPALTTYAVLDAGKVANLPDLLEGSGLDHRCLFKGAAEEELKTVAPWLVQIEEGNRFSRNLFTAGDAPWQLWDKAPGLILRTRAGFEEVWKHLRHFTRVRGPADEWLYWRFWESGALAVLLSSWRQNPEKAAAFMSLRTKAGRMPITFLCTSETAGELRALTPALAGMAPQANAPFALSKDDRRVLSHWRAHRFDRQLLASLCATYPRLAQARSDQATAWMATVIAGAENAELRQERAIEDFAHSAYLLSDDPTRHGETMHYLKDRTLHPNDRARLARRAAEAYVRTRSKETQP